MEKWQVMFDVGGKMKEWKERKKKRKNGRKRKIHKYFIFQGFMTFYYSVEIYWFSKVNIIFNTKLFQSVFMYFSKKTFLQKGEIIGR